MDVEFQLQFRRPEGFEETYPWGGSRNLDGYSMHMSVFFDRKVANEDNPFLDKFEL